MGRLKRLTPLAAILTAACMNVPSSGPAALGAAPFPVLGFFDGRSEGRATLKVAFRGRVPVRVESLGRIEAGTLVLRQIVHEGAKPPRERAWRIRETAPGHFAGTLSDAAGPVTADATPGRLHIVSAMKDGVAAEQWLTLAPDGRSAHNVLTARKFGIVVAVLDETIRKL
jgi:hypothetical protein